MTRAKVFRRCAQLLLLVWLSFTISWPDSVAANLSGLSTPSMSGAHLSESTAIFPQPVSPHEASTLVSAELGKAPTVTAAAWAATEQNGEAELLVLLRAQVDLAQLPLSGSKASRGQAVYAALRRNAAITQRPLRAWLAAQHIPYRSFYIVNALVVEADRTILMALAARPEIAHITTNPRIRSHSEPPESHLTTQALDTLPWGLQRINAPQVWAMGYQGEGVVVAGQDTGYQWDHPALQTHYRGWDGVTANHDYNWHDAIHDGGGICGADSPIPCDDNGHGTHTMGTIVGDDGAGNRIGVAPGAQWIGCRNMDRGYGTPATYAECFEFFLAPYPVGGDSGQGDPSKAPDVVNNSWSCPTYEGCDATHTAFLEQVVTAVRAAGILVVAAATNDGPACGSILEPPAIYDAAYTIGATDSTDTIASFSSRGTLSGPIKPDLVAPGVSVYASYPEDTYTYLSGTSMAAPHVTGAVALLWSAHPALIGRIPETEHILAMTALPRTSTLCGDSPDAIPNRVYGWGRLDALAAVEQALSGTLTGIVRDTDVHPLVGVTITATSVGATTQGQSDLEGHYTLSLTPDIYTVTASLPGYPIAGYPDIVIEREITTTLAITLTRGPTMYLPLVFNAAGF